jgi:hypothetical protein
LDELREDAVDGLGVHEGDLRAEETAARGGIDQPRPLALEAHELGRQILDLVRKVVHPRAALREEPPDRRVRAECREQLDMSGADPQRRGLDPLCVLRLAPGELGAEEALVARDRIIEILDRDADVVHALHRRDSTFRLARHAPLRLRQRSDRADRLRGTRLRLDLREQLVELVPSSTRSWFSVWSCLRLNPCPLRTAPTGSSAFASSTPATSAKL